MTEQITGHIAYRFSVTIRSDDLAVVNCLRSLAQYSQNAGNNRITTGGTTDTAWQRDGHTVTFRFSTPSFRQGLLAEARRLLPADLWLVVGQSDDDPATPQGR